MNIEIWKNVASKWRTVEDTVQPLSIVEEITMKAAKEIKEKGLLVTALDYLTSDHGHDEEDEDDDWP
jgi:hypothetical protein